MGEFNEFNRYFSTVSNELYGERYALKHDKIYNIKDYENWRNGKIPYLEKVCKGILNKISKTVKEICKYLKQVGLKKFYIL